MSDNKWSNIQARYKNSVVQIIVSSGSYSLFEPYRKPRIIGSRGSGFLVSEDGYILTNSHVMEGVLDFHFKSPASGKQILSAKLVAMCPDKDIALLKASDESMEVLRGRYIPFTIGDDFELNVTDPVLTIGYPLGRERVKFTSGVMSGYETPNSEDGKGTQSYIQIDATINPGNSGGPLVNLQGQVVGINSAGMRWAQATNYAIPSRVILSILSKLFEMENERYKILHTATVGLITQKLTPQHFKALGFTDPKGVRVVEIIPTTPFKDVQVGDIILGFEYADPYSEQKFFEVDFHKNMKTLKNVRAQTLLSITKHGNVRTFSIAEDSTTESVSKSRTVELQDILDSVPIGSVIFIRLFRPSTRKMITQSATFENTSQLAIRPIYRPFDAVDYVIFGGILWGQATEDTVFGSAALRTKYRKYKARNENSVIVFRIFPSTEIYEADSISAFSILKKVNGVEIETLEDMKRVLLNSPDQITLDISSDKQTILSKSDIRIQDQAIHKKFELAANDFSKKLWRQT